ncbi:MAG: hypothetical protein J4N69_03985 [Chloroflexi bacterium]|nr:hypothetical protein [Chloroflexota bacterium]MCI0788674.1 hypothetical protein [Chloroflexota bacterium]MCI0863379.1 hypothetical protein [Chloroflexota bacterium]
MTKTRFLALVTALALLLAIPTAAFAQNARPHVFVGTVTLDGATAVDGAAVTAWVDGEQVAATNASGGQYVLQVESTTGYAGKTVSFKVSGANASQTIVWEEGGGDILNLTATTGSGSGPGGDPGSRGPAGPAGATGATGATGGPGPAGAAGSDGSAGSAGPAGPAGATGSAGSAGSAGTAGAAGDDGGGALALIALIVAIVALLAAGGSYMMGRRA